MHSMPAQIDKAYGLIQPVVSGTVESIAWEKKRVGRDLWALGFIKGCDNSLTYL